ncbi:6079_t:CDS:2 [Scutellospora calospora]|uniref:6079_t:CDS:1 n=1 Tax=Scutellospora calospora TaxID=85575 RepID=A0ACA9M5L3_9GLOM|nr:6079_t:CDS:2 [Scutellospora calospora]
MEKPEAIAKAVEELSMRHKNESKDLELQITKLKKTAKGDKKRQKEVQAEANKLRTELRQRQQKEIQELKTNEIVEETNRVIESTSNEDYKEPSDNEVDILDQLYARLEATRIEEEKNDKPVAPLVNEIANKQKKSNRQKLRKERKAAKLAEEQNEAAEAAKNQINMTEIERNAITELIKPMGLIVEEVNYQEVRHKAAMYMRQHPDDFIPFLSNTKNTKDGEIYSLEQFHKYCDELEKTATWGGELEIIAISRVYKVPIHVVQMSSPILKMSDDIFFDKDPILLSYPLITFIKYS